jgi:hypothetical protein
MSDDELINEYKNIQKEIKNTLYDVYVTQKLPETYLERMDKVFDFEVLLVKSNHIIYEFAKREEK